MNTAPAQPAHITMNRWEQIRKALKLTQQELADKLGISLNFMEKIEVAFSKPALDTLIEIAEKLETSGSDLTRF